MATLTFPLAFAATLAVEVPVWTGLLRATVPLPASHGVRVGVAVNLLSHPVFWFALFPALSSWMDEWVAFAISEMVVVGGEAAMAHAHLRRREAPASWGVLLGVALSANLASIGAGFLLQGG